MKRGTVQRLRDGDAAPDFTTTDVAGNTVALSQITASRVLLTFFRYSGCPWCNLAVHRLTLEYDRIRDNDCEVVAFIQSEPSSIQKNIYGRHTPKPPFPIIADHEEQFYRLYGVTPSKMAILRSVTKLPDWARSVKIHGFSQGNVDGNVFMVPAAFVINQRTHSIEKAMYGASFYDHEAFVKVYESIIFTEL